MQKASLVADCTVTPVDLVVLSNQFAFDVEWGKNVSYFQLVVINELAASRLTDEEIISILDERDRYVKDDDYFYHALSSYDNTAKYLSPLTSYVIYTLAHDAKGNRGDLMKTKVTTKSDDKQPAATISNLKWIGDQWRCYIEINAYAVEYYRVWFDGSSTSDGGILEGDYYYAYCINKYIKMYPDLLTAAVQSSYWYYTPDQIPYVEVATWAKGKDGEWSGILNTNYSSKGGSSSMAAKKTAPVKNGCGRAKKPDLSKIKVSKSRR